MQIGAVLCIPVMRNRWWFAKPDPFRFPRRQRQPFLGTAVQTGRELSFHGETSKWAEGVARFVRDRGGQFLFGHMAVNVDTARRKIRVQSVPKSWIIDQFQEPLESDSYMEEKARSDESAFEISYDQLVMASPIGSITIDRRHPLDEVAKVNTQSDDPQFRYTQELVVLVELDRLPPIVDKWDLIFEVPDERAPLQLVSFAHFGHVGKPRFIALIFHVRFKTQLRGWSLSELQANPLPVVTAMESTDMFRTSSCRILRVVDVHWFDHAMPVCNFAAMRAIEAAQGINNIWYAGQGVAGHPLFEHAVYSGRLAGLRAVSPIEARAFQDRFRTIDRDTTRRWKRSFCGKLFALALFCITAIIIIGML